jgi:hypothetical protein
MRFKGRMGFVCLARRGCSFYSPPPPALPGTLVRIKTLVFVLSSVYKGDLRKRAQSSGQGSKNELLGGRNARKAPFCSTTIGSRNQQPQTKWHPEIADFDPEARVAHVPGPEKRDFRGSKRSQSPLRNSPSPRRNGLAKLIQGEWAPSKSPFWRPKCPGAGFEPGSPASLTIFGVGSPAMSKSPKRRSRRNGFAEPIQG